MSRESNQQNDTAEHDTPMSYRSQRAVNNNQEALLHLAPSLANRPEHTLPRTGFPF